MRALGVLRGAGLVILPSLALGCAAAETAVDGERAAIEEVLVSAYVEGIHRQGDEAAVRAGFHPEFVMAVYDEGAILPVDLEMWIEHLDLDGEPNTDTIDYVLQGVDVTGNAATAKMDVFENGEHIYTDYFGLYRFPEGWRIVNKLFYSHGD